ncbi:MAG: hypothetical protein ABJ360_02240 [Roseobacter sp.]|uniref:hypothetical protein n=1 Tax=Tateyamaria sp. TaxID=1929288 RepID=UPI0032726559
MNSQLFVRYAWQVSVLSTAVALAACAPSPAQQDYASPNVISFKYEAWDEVPTLTAEALDKAVQHCSQYGKYANYKGGSAVSVFSAEEIHQFACEDKKTDDSAIIAQQSKRPDYVYLPSLSVTTPTHTSCNTMGTFTNCTTY